MSIAGETQGKNLGPEEPEGPRSNHPSGATLRNILLFCVAMALAVTGLTRQLPPGGDAITEIKLAGLRQQGSNCNLLIMGSSVSFHGVKPKTFDAATAMGGIETRTYNMAMPGTLVGETFHILQRIAENPPEQLRWILIEADSVMRVHAGGEFLSPKNIAWHDLESLPILLGYPEELDIALSAKWKSYWRNSVVTAYNTLGVARGVPWIENSLGLTWKGMDRVRWLGPARDGFRPIAWNPDESSRYIRRRYLKRRGFYRFQLKKLVQTEPAIENPRPSVVPFFDRIDKLAREMGVQVIYYTLRGRYEGSDSVALAKASRIQSLLRLDDVKRYPELFDIANFYDGIHFTAAGADLFSTYLAQEFLSNEARSTR